MQTKQPDKSRADDWYAARRGGIGGSDAAVALGLSPWKTPVQLWREKRGETEEIDISHKQYVYWGTRLEDIIAQEYEARTGRETFHLGRIVTSSVYPWMKCNIDRAVRGSDRLILEIKNVGLFVWTNGDWGDDGSSDVPPYYYAQCQHNIVCCKANQCDMPILIGGNDYRCYRLPRDERFIEAMIERERQFWQCVVDGTPPPPMKPSDMLLLYPSHVAGKMVEATEEIASAVARLRRARELQTAVKLDAERHRMIVQEYMGDAEYLTFNGEPIVTWRKPKKGEGKRRGRTFKVRRVPTEMEL
jgi:putative phage-type endonuclease